MKSRPALDLLAQMQDERLASPTYGRAPGQFDAWSATEEEAIKLADTLKSPFDHANPVLRWHRAQRVLSMRAEIEQGDGGLVMDAVAECVLSDLQLPAWLASAFLKRWRSVRHADVGTWDAAFGRPWPKGTQLARERFAKNNAVHAHLAALCRVQADPNRPLDKALWEEVGEEIGVGATLAEELARSFFSLRSLAQVKANLQGTKPTISKKVAGLRKKR